MEGFAQQALIGPHAVELGRVEMVDALIDGFMEEFDAGFRSDRRTIEFRQAHTAQTHRIHEQAGMTDFSLDHVSLSRCGMACFGPSPFQYGDTE